MVDVARKRVTYAEYVVIANDSAVKYEYIAGEIVAMWGGTVAHGRLIGRVAGCSIARSKAAGASSCRPTSGFGFAPRTVRPIPIFISCAATSSGTPTTITP